MQSTQNVPLFFDPLAEMDLQNPDRTRRAAVNSLGSGTKGKRTPQDRSSALQMVAADLIALRKRYADRGPQRVDPA